MRRTSVRLGGPAISHRVPLAEEKLERETTAPAP
jgi:hypothetical protein